MAKTGSEKLFTKAMRLDDAQLETFASLSAEYGEIKRWCPYGQPAIDGLCAKIIVNHKAIGRFVDELIATEVEFDCGVFPLGKPGIDGVLVDLNVGALHH